MNKKGITSSLLVLIVVLFILAIFSIVSQVLWTEYETVLVNATNITNNTLIPPDVMNDILEANDQLNIADNLFVMCFVLLVVAFLISCSVTPSENPIFFLIFLGFLVFTTIISMVLSNAWVYIAENPNFVGAVASLGFIDYIMRYYPVITLIIGLMGGIIFYARKQTEFVAQGGGDNFE